MYKFKFTIFTPTYNRGSTLYRVFESLKNQSYKDFEWLIIDDGSTDNTSAVIDEFSKIAEFPIRYFYQDNNHKFHTILKAVGLAEGELFYIVDSDDEIFPTALETLMDYWLGIPDSYRIQYSGITGLCVDQNDELVGSKFPADIFDSNTLESSVKFKIKGEKSGFQRTDLLREFHFDDNYFNNGYIPEGILWISLANKGYITRYINITLRRYYVNDGDSIMTSAKFIPNAFGTFQFTLLFLNSFKPFFINNLRLIIGQIRNYTVSGWVLGHSSFFLLKNLKYMVIRILYIFTLPISILYSINVNKK